MSALQNSDSDGQHTQKKGSSIPSFLIEWSPVLIPVVIMWALHFLNFIIPADLRNLGVRPRELEGLWGVLFMPVLHNNFEHLVSNSVPWLGLGTLILLMTKRYVSITVSIWLLSGILTWIIGRPDSLHAGASGIIYGYAAFLMIYGFLSRRFFPFVVSLATILAYAGLFWGVFPTDARVSWEGHLAGAVAGIIVAFAMTRTVRKERQALNSAKKYAT